MNLLLAFASFLIGLISGVGLTLLYIQYKMYSQVGKMEEQMQEVMDLETELEEEMRDE